MKDQSILLLGLLNKKLKIQFLKKFILLKHKLIKNYGNIEGLYIINDFIDEDTERRLFNSNMFQKHNNNKVTEMYSLNMTKFTDDVFKIIKDLKQLNIDFNIDHGTAINYNNGSGLPSHNFSRYKWGPLIISICLGLDMCCKFTRKGFESVIVKLPRNSVYIMSGDSRTKWKHSIISNREYKAPDWNIYKMRRSILLREYLYGPRSYFKTKEELINHRKKLLE